MLDKEKNSDPTILRCPHDEEHPYVSVSKALVRDNSLSPEATFLLIYLLANKENWEIRMKVLVKQLHGRMAKTPIYRCVNELIEKGYMKREITVITPSTGKGKLKGACKIYISERPKFKECLRHPGNRDTDNRYSENGEAIMNNKENPSDSLNEEQKNECPPAANAANPLSSFLFEKIKEAKKSEGLSPPKRPNFTEWDKEFRLIVDRDKRDPETLKALISWALTDKFWKKNILSPSSLRRNFDKLEMDKKDAEINNIQKLAKEKKTLQEKGNKDTFFNAKNRFPTYFTSVKIKNYGICSPEKGLDVAWGAPTQIFEDILCKMTGLAPKRRES